MFFSALFLLVSLLSAALAQTPSGFIPSVSNQLTVMFNSTVVSPAGKQLSKATTQSQPTIGVSGVAAGKTFMFVMLDLDVPSKTGPRQTLLHAMETGFKASTKRAASSASMLTSSGKAPAPYIGPSPPAENPAFGHRYVQLLFAEPDNFAVPASQTAAVSKRIGFNITAFMKDAALAEPLAANFFVVEGKQEAGATGASGTAAGSDRSTATGSGGISKSTLEPFEGGAGSMKLGMRGVWAGLLGGVAVALV
ncbi:PEBP-like protein [Mytilinidion resinicola]|uniref:PEBP-like protein n=1 Tax=Mytilinidion resinicola TaxID=574789 RepID=A0A6A6Z562_9PEZI|nr:PEBP-like protein [Mytilinidion resinicola]KAF2816160.1 PEBP-like protein [Mytilinidion resinicola]